MELVRHLLTTEGTEIRLSVSYLGGGYLTTHSVSQIYITSNGEMNDEFERI
jgi:hypothetical protein